MKIKKSISGNHIRGVSIHSHIKKQCARITNPCMHADSNMQYAESVRFSGASNALLLVVYVSSRIISLYGV